MLLTRLTHPAVLAVCAAVTLLAALGYQYLGGYQPCVLCIWQRWPLVAAMGLAVAALAFPPGSPGRRAALGGMAISFITGAGLGGFHVGVEQHWWPGLEGCGSSALDGGAAMTDLRAQLLATPVVRCDEVTWSVLGISMAGYNMMISLGLAAFALIGAVGRRSGTPARCEGHNDGRIHHGTPTAP